MRATHDRAPRPSSLRSGLTACCALLAIATAGCSVVRPEARAKDVRMVESVGGVTKVDIALELRNTGDDEVDLLEYDYVVTLADGSAYGGKWAALRALPPGQTVEATIPAVLPSASVGGAWRVNGTLRYRDPQSIARILYESGLLRTEVGFSGAGSSILPALQAPAAVTGQ